MRNDPYEEADDMGQRIEKCFTWAKRLIGSARVVVDKAGETVEGIKEELRKYGEEKKEPGKPDDR